MRIVISGAMCSGKTAVIDDLAKEFFVFEEAARAILRKHSKNSQQVDRDWFEREIIKNQLEHFREAEEISFFDSGFIDALSYYRMDNMEIPEDLYEIMKRFRYDKIFFLEPLKFFEQDDIRKETQEQREKLSKAILSLYNELDYEVIRVPFMSVKDRINFIKDRI